MPNRIDDKNPKALTAQAQKKVKDFLLIHGHNAAKVNGLDVATDAKLKDAMLAVHNVKPSEYRVVGGGYVEVRSV